MGSGTQSTPLVGEGVGVQWHRAAQRVPQTASLAGPASNSIFLQFTFRRKLTICPECKSMTAHQGGCCSLLFIPATLSPWSRTLKRLFELTLCPSRAFFSSAPFALLLESQRYTVRCAELVAYVPGQNYNHRRTNLDCKFVKNTTLNSEITPLTAAQNSFCATIMVL